MPEWQLQLTVKWDIAISSARIFFPLENSISSLEVQNEATRSGFDAWILGPTVCSSCWLVM